MKYITNLANTHTDYLAAALVTFGALIYNAGFIYSNEHKLHPVSNAMARGLTLYLLSYLYSYYKGIDLTFPSAHNVKWQTIRNGIVMVQGMCFNWSMYYLPLPIAFTINASSPLFVAVWDLLLYGVKLNHKQLCWLLIAFIGVILTINGNQIIAYINNNEQNTHTTFQHYLSKDPWMLTIVGVVFTLATCGHAFGSVITKKFRNTNSIHINYYQSIMVVFVTSILTPMANADTNYNRMSMEQLGWTVLLTGVPTALGGFAYITALTITKNYAMVTPFAFMGIVEGYFLSVLRYNQQLNVLCMLGSVAIMVGIVAIIYCKEVATN